MGMLPGGLSPGRLTDPALRRKFVRFCITGVLTAAVYFAALVALIEVAGAAPWLAGLIAFLIAISFNYVLHKRWTFESDRRHREAMPRFLVTVTIGGLLNVGILHALSAHAGFHYLAAQAVAIGCVLAWNFLMLDRWAFLGGLRRQAPAESVRR